MKAAVCARGIPRIVGEQKNPIRWEIPICRWDKIGVIDRFIYIYNIDRDIYIYIVDFKILTIHGTSKSTRPVASLEKLRSRRKRRRRGRRCW